MGEEDRRERRERWLQTVAFFGALLVLAVVLYLAFVVQGNAPQEKPTPTLPMLPTTRVMPTPQLVPTPAATAYPRPAVTAPGGPTPGPYPVLVLGPYYRFFTTTPGAPLPVRPIDPGVGAITGPWWAGFPGGGPTPTPCPVSAEGSTP